MFERLLARKTVLLADGAMATNLFDLGLRVGDAPELWLTQHPERVQAVHKAFVDAGADIILTNTFGANRRRLALCGVQDQTAALNRRAVELARAVIAEAGRPVALAGSVGPTGDVIGLHGTLGEPDCVEIFVEQMQGLKDGGTDVLWLETMSAFEEMRAAAEAARRVGMPYVMTASFHHAGRTTTGLAPEAFARDLSALEPAPLAIGANCGAGASDLIATILAMTEAWPGAIVVAKANCGLPRVVDGKLEYPCTPDLMSAYARLAVDAGARFIGGCCGTTPGHLTAMRQAIDTHVRGPRPTLEQIVTSLGPLTNGVKA